MGIRICDPADPSRALWVLRLELDSLLVMPGVDGGGDDDDDDDDGGGGGGNDDDDDDDNDDDDDDDDDDDENRLTLGRDRFLRQLERLKWV